MRAPVHGLGFVLLSVVVSACGGSEPADSDQNTGGSGGKGASGSGGSSQGGGGASSGAGGTSAGGGTGGTASGGAGGTASGGTGGTNGAGSGSGGSAGEFTPDGTPPDLEPGVWKDITPEGLQPIQNFGTVVIEVDPVNTATLYLTADEAGLWKSQDGGTSWTRLGTPPAQPNHETTTTYLDSPVAIRVDPGDSNHLYATQGVRGATQGFWVSTDAGESWALSPGFLAVSAEIATRDMTKLIVDPNDFEHVLVGSHQPWAGLNNAGILETTDGGDTFVKHLPPAAWAVGSIGIQFLYNPKLGIGDKNTWLVNTENQDGSFWRTTDAGANWTHLASNLGGLHGGAAIYYANNGTIYSGAWGAPLRSTDNGVTWSTIQGLPYSTYITIMGDGNTMFTNASGAAGGCPYDYPYYVSAENDGQTWTEYQSGAQKFCNGPATMVFDSVTGILYSANWATGLWALKVIAP